MLKLLANWIMHRRANQLAGLLAKALDGLSSNSRLDSDSKPDSDAGVGSNFSVADIGSGTGHNAQALRELNFEVQQFDVADLHWVGEPPTRISKGRVPVDDQTFDAVLLAYVLQYPPQASQVLREASRLLKTGGRVLIVQCTYRSRLGFHYLRWREWLFGPLGFYLARLTRLIDSQPCPVVPNRYYQPATLQTELREAGLFIEQQWIREGWLTVCEHHIVVTPTIPVQSPAASNTNHCISHP